MFRITLALLLAGSACATYNNARPLEPGQHAISATFGGPLTEVPNVGTIPLPNLTLEGRHGVAHHLDVNYGLHILPLAFGVAGMHVGGTYQLFDQPTVVVPALSVGQRFFAFTNAIDTRKPNPSSFAMSQTDLTTSWEVLDQLVWIGASGYLPFNEPHLHLAPFAGVELRPFEFLRLGVEARWLNPAINQEFAVVNWVAPDSHGAILVTAGLAFVFGGAQ
jgi:hypothetical protein